MKTNFNVTGERRKELVKLLAQVLQTEYRYCGVPSCAYEVGELVVDVEGTVIGDLSDYARQTLANQGFSGVADADVAVPLAFDSDAKEIQHYMKLVLSDGKTYSAKELKEKIAQMANRNFSAGAYAGAFRELVENDCRYSAEERGHYRYTEFDGNPDLLPFLSILVSANSKLERLQQKSPSSDIYTADKIKYLIEQIRRLTIEYRQA